MGTDNHRKDAEDAQRVESIQGSQIESAYSVLSVDVLSEISRVTLEASVSSLPRSGSLRLRSATL